MNGNIGREQSVIPFQVPSLGKIAYEHQLRNQQKQEREDYRREQRAENLTSGIYGGMLKLNEGQRQQAQPLYDEIIELATRYEQGEDVYNDLRQKTEMFKAAMNGAVGLNSAWSEKAALYEQDPSKFQDDETAWNDKRNMYSKGLGSFYDYADVTKSKELFVNTTPQEKRALSKWMTPNELVQFNWLQTSKEFSKENRQLLPSGDYRVTSTIDAEKAKPEIVSQLRTYANDPDALSGMVTFYLGRAATPEEVADIAKNENSLNDVLDKYADVVLRTQQAKQQERGYNINMPSPQQPKEQNKKTYGGYGWSRNPTEKERPFIDAMLNTEKGDGYYRINVLNLGGKTPEGNAIDAVTIFDDGRLAVEVLPTDDSESESGKLLEGDDARNAINRNFGTLWQEWNPQVDKVQNEREGKAQQTQDGGSVIDLTTL